MVMRGVDRSVRAVALNQALRLPPVAWLKHALRRDRGGVLWHNQSETMILRHITGLSSALRPSAGDPAGKVALEIGPCDNVALAYCSLRSGCSRAIAVEKIASIL